MIPQKQGSPEWLEWRKDKIGGSDASTIMGVNPYENSYDLYMRKKGLAQDKPKTTAMQRGNDLEETARQWYIQQGRPHCLPRVIAHPEYTWMIASMDGMNFDSDFGIEIKCPGTNVLKNISRYGIPEHYFCQVQHQLFVADLESMDLIVFDGFHGQIFTIDRDQDYILKLLDKEIAFMECLKNNTPPENTKAKGKIEYESIETDEWKSIAEELRALDVRSKRDKALSDSLRERAKEIAGGRNLRGYGMSLSNTKRRGTVKYDQIPELKNVDLEKYRSEDISVTTIGFD